MCNVPNGSRPKSYPRYKIQVESLVVIVCFSFFVCSECLIDGCKKYDTKNIGIEERFTIYLLPFFQLSKCYSWEENMTKQSPLGFSASVYDNVKVDWHYQRRHKEHDKDFNCYFHFRIAQANFTKWLLQSKAKLVFLSNPWSCLGNRVRI